MDDRIEEVEQVLGMVEEIGTIIRGWNDPYLNAYVVAEFKGQDGGWLGDFTRDRIARYLTHLRDEADRDIPDALPFGSDDLADVPFPDD